MEIHSPSKPTMLETKIFQSEWHNINFSDLNIELSRDSLPEATFYDKFYSELRKKYSSYSQLDKHWIRGKIETSGRLIEKIKPSGRVLSYGCGIAFVERIIAFCLSNTKVYGYDFAENFSHFSQINTYMPKNLHLLHGANNPLNTKSTKFDTIIACQLLYALEKKEIESLVSRFAGAIKEEGNLIIVHHPPSKTHINEFTKNAKKLIGRAAQKIVGIRPKEMQKRQFWGWSRDDETYIRICASAGMKLYSKSKDQDGQSFLEFRFKTTHK